MIRQRKNPPPRYRKGEPTEQGSRFIGVSRNGKKWQALLLVNERKRYLGTLDDELETALLHDRGAILHHGLKRVRGKKWEHVGPDELFVLEERYL